MNPMYLAPLKITAYLCQKCGKCHKAGSKLFAEHYASTFDEQGKYRPVAQKS